LRTFSVATLEPPKYAQVPIVREDPSVFLSEMPKLALSGQQADRPQDALDASLAKLTLDQPMSIDALPAESVTSAVAAAGHLPPEPNFARLDNGVRVVTVDRGGLCASVGLFVNCGSRYMKADECCIPHALELMAFRSSEHLTHVRTLKTLEQLGAAASCRVGREDIVYQVDVLRDYVPVMLPLMLSNLLCPSLLPEEVAAAHESVIDVQNALKENTEGMLSELLHQAAYQGNTLGQKLYADEKDLPKFTAEALRKFIREQCTPDRLIVIGVNVNFEEICKWTARSFAEHSLSAASAPAKSMPPALYTGGEIRIAEQNPLCHLMFGWEVLGGWNGHMLAAITVLQMFLGGGGSFSTGGPGKGMHTRLYTDVLNRHQWVESCQASSAMYADSGLFTVYATVLHENAADFVTVLARIFAGLSRLSEEELQRAKNALKSSIHMNLEMRAVMMEDIGRQLVLAGKVGTAYEFGKMVDAVTADDLRAVLRECLKTKLTVLAYGAVQLVPSYEHIEKVLKSSVGHT
jgi:processing peptidase subunit alpha